MGSQGQLTSVSLSHAYVPSWLPPPVSMLVLTGQCAGRGEQGRRKEEGPRGALAQNHTPERRPIVQIPAGRGQDRREHVTPGGAQHGPGCQGRPDCAPRSLSFPRVPLCALPSPGRLGETCPLHSLTAAVCAREQLTCRKHTCIYDALFNFDFCFLRMTYNTLKTCTMKAQSASTVFQLLQIAANLVAGASALAKCP